MYVCMYLVRISNLNCWYQQFKLLISLINCWYQQFELEISTIADITNSKWITDISNLNSIISFTARQINPLIATLKPQSNGPLLSSSLFITPEGSKISHKNTKIHKITHNWPNIAIVIGTLAVDRWAVTFCTARRGLGGPQPRCTKCNSPPVNGTCTNFVLYTFLFTIKMVVQLTVRCCIAFGLWSLKG